MDYGWTSDNTSNKRSPQSRAPEMTSKTRSPPLLVMTHDSQLDPAVQAHYASAVDQQPLRRPRADTMPTRSFPYAQNDIYSTLAVPAHSARHRSGSVTLPSEATELSLFGGAFDSGASIEDNASSTVASTLASLGLDDENDNTQQQQQQQPLPSSSKTGSRAGTPAPTSASYNALLQPDTATEGLTRGRAYTVAGRPPALMDHLALGGGGHLDVSSFTPFSPQTRSSVLQRPRAFSFGVGDVESSPLAPPPPPPPPGMSSYARYEFGAAPTLPRLSQPLSMSNLLQQQSSGLSGLPTSDAHHHHQRMLRGSRSSGNLLELNRDMFTATHRAFGGVGSQIGHLPPEMHAAKDYYMAHGFPSSATLVQKPVPSTSTSSSAAVESPPAAPAQVPSRALWLGNINPSVSVPELIEIFSQYGHVESARILSDKECAFVNFSNVESAVKAKNDFETRLGSMLAGTPVRVGFGKADVNVAMALTNEAGPNAQGPTRALWVGNIPANMNPAILRTIFQPFGPIESVRVLSHKNCGFVNFEHQEDAVRARKALQNKEILGAGTGAVRIGFAKVPSNEEQQHDESGSGSHSQMTTPDTYQATQWATAMMISSILMNASGGNGNQQQQPQQLDLYTAIVAERRFIMKQLGVETEEDTQKRTPAQYCTVIPSVPDFGSDRKLEPLRLREMRKQLDMGQLPVEEIERIAVECEDEIVELCSDYIGNTVVQRIFENCGDETKQKLLKKIAPHLAAIGVHKNGTWAAQKIIDHSTRPSQVQLIRDNIKSYVPLLLLDQFGNYVVQCCLNMGEKENQFIFDAIVDKCWEIGQGRFGARAVRAILENPKLTKEQQVYVAAAIVQNAVLLTTNANGTLLLIWYLDTADIEGRFKVLCPRLLPYLSRLCTHKLGSMTVLKVIMQQQEPDARNMLINGIFNDNSVLDEILKDQVHGVNFVQKVLQIPGLQQRAQIVRQVRDALTNRLKVQQHTQSYRKLMDELDSAAADANMSNDGSPVVPGNSSLTSDIMDNNNTAAWMQNPQTVAMMANMYAAAMTAAAATTSSAHNSNSQSQPQQPTNTLDLGQFDQLLKSLLQQQKPSSPSSQPHEEL